jgi:uncharacterized membrane protein (UPF0127 family)
MMRRFLISALAIALAACSPNSGEAGAQSTQSSPAAHPVSGLPVIPLKVIHGSKTFTFRVELARTPQEQSKGLMFRTELGPDEGMIFPFEPARGASFWMRNTVISLDLIFVGTDGRISNIAAGAIPYDESPLSSVGFAKAVLELRGGRAAELGIVPGDKVEW